MKLKPFATLWDLVNAHLFGAQPEHRRILAAYDLAWAKVDRAPSAENVPELIEQLKTLQVAGLRDLDGGPVSPWIHAWRDGLDPNAAEARAIAAA